MNRVTAPRLDDQLCFALYAASRAVIAAYQPALDEHGITYPQYLVLMVLWEEDGCRVSRLGERMQLDSGTLSPLLKRLEQRGLVERKRRADDERVVEIFLTAEGKRLKKTGALLQEQSFCRLGLTLPELEKLRGQLQTITKTLGESK